MSDYKSFDAFIEETEQKVGGFTFKGQQFELPEQLPAKVMLRNLRGTKKKPSNEDLIQQYESFFTDILGPEQYERLLDTGISLDGLNKLLPQILNLYKVGGESSNPKEGYDPSTS